jgi:hypothetical protein
MSYVGQTCLILSTALKIEKDRKIKVKEKKMEKKEKEKTKLEDKIEKRCHGQVDMLTIVRATESERSRVLTKGGCMKYL